MDFDTTRVDPLTRPSSRQLPVAPACPIGLLLWTAFPHIERLAARGLVVRVAHGVYADSTAWRALKPWQRYLGRVHAIALTHPFAVFSHESAAALLGLPLVGDPLIVHITEPEGATARLAAGVRTHLAQRLDDVVDLGGILATGPVATMVDHARTRHPALALAVADAALRRYPAFTAGDAQADNEGRPSSRGRRLARWALQRADAAAESPLESFSRACVEWLGFEQPQLQVEFRRPDGSTDRADFWWAQGRVIGEADGDIKYDGSLGTRPLAVIRAEKERDRRLLHQANGIAHWGWNDLAHSDRLRDALAAEGLRPVAPPETARLGELRALLRRRP